MIPKIIHLCWLSGDEFPEAIQHCIDSWKIHLPDYEIYLWDTNRFDINSSRWVKEAFEAKKYAFAADYIRLYALYHHGGIYLDSDVIVYKSFNDLLNLPYFIGEDITHCFEAAVIGAEKGCEWIGHIMKRYENRRFIKSDNHYDTKTLPAIFHDQLIDNYDFTLIKNKDCFLDQETVINVFTYDYFNSRDYVSIKQYPNSYCSHNFAGSWFKDSNLRKEIRHIMPRTLLNTYYKYRIALSYLIRISNKPDLRIPYTINHI